MSTNTTRRSIATMSILAAAIGIGSLSISHAAYAQSDRFDRRILIENDTDENLVGLQASNVGEDYYSHNLLRRVMAPGASGILNLEDYSGYCRYDIKYTFDDGTVLFRDGVDACTLQAISLRD